VSEHGRVLEVVEVSDGDYLLTSVSNGRTTLALEDASLFPEDGGKVVVVAEDGSRVIYTYSTADWDQDVLTLSGGVSTIVSHSGGDAALVSGNPASSRYALVQPDDDELPPVKARVPYSMRAQLPLGMRSDVVGDADTQALPPEEVVLELIRGSWMVDDVVGTVPIVEGKLIDFVGANIVIPPGSVPLSDGFVPSSSPTPVVTPMLTQFFIKWPGVTNSDAITYEIHISKTAGFSTSASTLVGETSGTIATVRIQSSGDGGGNLQYNVNYYFRIVAKDRDGAHAAGTQVGPYQINKLFGSDISAGAITADKITAGIMTAAVTLSGYIGSDTKGAATQHWEADADGIRLIGPSGQLLAELPTDPIKPVKVVGDLTAGSLESASATLHGLTSLDVGATFEVSSSLSNPVSAPSVVHSAESMTFAATAPAGEKGIGLGWDGTNFTYLQSEGYPPQSQQQVFYKVNTSGAIVSSVLLDTSGLDGDQVLYSLVKLGSWWYGIGGFTPKWVIFADVAGSPAPTPTTIASFAQWRGWYREPMIATNGTNLWVCQSNRTGSGGAPNDKMWVGFYSVSGSAAPTFLSNVTTDIDLSEGSPVAFCVNDSDLAATRYWIQSGGGGVRVRSFTTGGLVQNSEEWYTSSAADGGIIWDGTQFRSRNSSQRTLSKYTNFRSANGPTTAFALAYTWYDSAGTTHETALSPRKLATLNSRWRVSVSWPTIPGAGGADDPNSIRLYMTTSGTDPGGLWSSYFIQGTTFSGVQTYLTAFSSTTAGPGSVTAFPTSIPSTISAENGAWFLRGDGTVQLHGSLSYSTWFFNDLLGPISDGPSIMPAFSSGTGAGPFVLNASEANHPGIWKTDTGSTNSGYSGMFGSTGGVLLGSGKVRFGAWIKTAGNLSDGTDTYRYMIGLISGGNTDTTITDGVILRYCHSINSGKWEARTVKASATTVLDTGVLAVTINTWYFLEVEINAAGTQADFYVDHVLVCSITTNIPTVQCRPALVVSKHAGTGARGFSVDAFHFYEELAVAR
jgi:hypothetical protein